MVIIVSNSEDTCEIWDYANLIEEGLLSENLR